MKKISLFLMSLVVSANLYANESNKSQNQHNNHIGNHTHDGKMMNHMNKNGMTDEEMKNMHKNMSEEEMKEMHKKMSNDNMKNIKHK